jgi:hypothetical protein
MAYYLPTLTLSWDAATVDNDMGANGRERARTGANGEEMVGAPVGMCCA